MNPDNFKGKIIYFVLRKDFIFKPIATFIISLLSFLVIDSNFGYMTTLSNPWIAVAMSVLCSFIPINLVGVVMFAFLELQFLSLSLGLSILFGVVWVFFAVLSGVCQSKHRIHLTLMPILLMIHIPFIAVVYEAYFGRKREAVNIIGGAFIAFLLRAIKLSESAFLTNDDEINSFIVLKDNTLSSTNFYVFIIGVALLFLLITLMRHLPMKKAWLISGVVGVLVEFVTIVVGYMFSSSQSQILILVISNIITLLFVAILSLMFEDLKINQRKELEFEDDDYTYHVVCTPKVRVEENKKRVVRITRSKKEIEQDKLQETEE